MSLFGSRLRKRLPWLGLGALLLGVLLLGLSACTGPQGLLGPSGPAGPTGPAGPQGSPGPLPAGTVRQIDAVVTVSKPANGTHLVAGERATVTVTLKDQFGGAFTKDDFATLALYVYGPQAASKAKSAVKLLNATDDRSKTPHHYIDLLKNEDAKVSGNVLTYELKAVTDEEAGTYTAAVRAVSKADALQQVMPLVDFQVGTATAEKQVVEPEKCAACHRGADSGKFYLHHVDPRQAGQSGSFSLDSDPVKSCKVCHNNEGYAAYRGNMYNPTGDAAVRTPDNIVLRVHGVHFGEELKNPFNTDPATGNFADYTGVVFPADVLNCDACHVDDRWETKPSVQACGACHDTTWFGDPAKMPTTFVAHAGGPQPNDAACATCHTPGESGLAPMRVVHDPKVNIEYDQAVLSMSAPANGKFFVAGEKPTVSIVINDASGKPIDHSKVDATTFASANLYVYGPRAASVPVLTAAARNGNSKASASVTSTIAAAGTPTKGWTFAAGDTFKIAANGGPVQELAAPVGLQTPDQVVAWLKASLKDVTVTANSAGNINLRSTVAGDKSRFEIYNSAVTTSMGWKPGGLDILEHGKAVGKTVGTTMEPFVAIGAVNTMANDLRSDPAATRTIAKIIYQMDDVAGLKPGTYTAFTYANPAGVKTKNGWARSAFGMVTFQVGTATTEPAVAANCGTCHGKTIMHLNESNVHPAPFDPEACKACHDYWRSGTGEGFSRTGGTSTSGWAGYGAKPIVARIHGVHRGEYLSHKEEVYAGNPNMASEIIFPQDIRNCTVCHDKTTSGTWKTEPSRLACNSCHDSDAAKTHARLNTQIGPSADPYGPDTVETCNVCHGAGREFAPDKVHNISNPYKPPYPREPSE